MELWWVMYRCLKQFIHHKVSIPKKICEEKGISIWRLEKDLGFSNRSVSKWNESEPGIRKVQKVADYLGVTIEELLK